MAKVSSEDNAKAIGLLLVILFIAGGYLVAWLVKQKVLFYQNMFWITLGGCLILLVLSIGLFIYFLVKEDNDYSYYPEFFDKSTLGWASLICFVLAIVLFFMMINAYQKGFSNEAMQKLAEAQGKLDEFNYIRDVLTGVEIERLMTEGFDEAMQDICTSNNYDCEQLTKSYQSIKDILEAKERADNIVKFIGLVENGN